MRTTVVDGFVPGTKILNGTEPARSAVAEKKHAKEVRKDGKEGGRTRTNLAR